MAHRSLELFADLVALIADPIPLITGSIPFVGRAVSQIRCSVSHLSCPVAPLPSPVACISETIADVSCPVPLVTDLVPFVTRQIPLVRYPIPFITSQISLIANRVTPIGNPIALRCGIEAQIADEIPRLRGWCRLERLVTPDLVGNTPSCGLHPYLSGPIPLLSRLIPLCPNTGALLVSEFAPLAHEVAFITGYGAFPICLVALLGSRWCTTTTLIGTHDTGSSSCPHVSAVPPRPRERAVSLTDGYAGGYPRQVVAFVQRATWPRLPADLTAVARGSWPRRVP